MKTSNLANKLIAVLNDGQEHDSVALAALLQVSQDDILQTVSMLMEWGVAIEVTKKHHFKLLQCLSLLDVERIQATCASLAVNVMCVSSTTSTNDCFTSHDVIDKNRFDFCLAEHQTAGRGRFGRTWMSPYAENVYLSCRYYVNQPLIELSGLSLVVGLAILTILQADCSDKQLKIKWPNDIVWQGKKIAGVLVELRKRTNDINEVIIGIGVNVNVSNHIKKQISQQISSLSDLHHGLFCDRTQVAINLIKQLIIDIDSFQTHGWQAFEPRWQEADYLQNQAVTLSIGDQLIHGIARGVNEYGELLLQRQNQSLMAYSSGEASVAKK